jgi:predicted anti-sigma-YlaC factor YlaD
VLTCREIIDNADQLLDGTTSRRQRLAVKAHLLMCRHCRRYVRQLRALLRAVPFMYGKASDAEVSRVMAHLHSHRTVKH